MLLQNASTGIMEWNTTARTLLPERYYYWNGVEWNAGILLPEHYSWNGTTGLECSGILLLERYSWNGILEWNYWNATTTGIEYWNGKTLLLVEVVGTTGLVGKEIRHLQTSKAHTSQASTNTHLGQKLLALEEGLMMMTTTTTTTKLLIVLDSYAC
jgi:hypothetical protein